MFGNGKYGFVGEELDCGLHAALLCLCAAQSLDVQITCRDTTVGCKFPVKGSKINVLPVGHPQLSHLPSPGL